jgi:hypothetical protein
MTADNNLRIQWAAPRDLTDWTPDPTADDNLRIMLCPTCGSEGVSPGAEARYQQAMQSLKQKR